MSESTKGADLLNKCQGLPFLDMPGNEIAELPGDIQGQWFILAMSQDKGRNAEVIPAGEKNSQNWIFDSNSIQMSTNYGYLTGDLVPSDAEEMPNIELPFEQVLSFGDVEGMPTYALHANAGVFWFIHHDVEGEKVLWRSINLTENNEVARVLLGRDQP